MSIGQPSKCASAAFSLFVMSAHGMTRRAALRATALATLSLCVVYAPKAAYALKPGRPSKETLLNRAREERTPEELAADAERRAAERQARLEKQRELQAAAERRREEGGGDQSQADIEANLRSNYYYPTARKRYLPRVRRALELLPIVETAVSGGDWRVVSSTASGPLEEAVLPMRLYASSLAGQGLSLSARFVQSMADDAGAYEDALRRLQKSVKRKDVVVAQSAVKDMGASIARYRTAGKLEAPDFGIGEIPKDKRVGSGLGNNNPALYNRNFKEILSETN